MRIRRFGISLVRLEEQHIETVRRWRNAPEIRDFMEFREHITPEMQQQWFRGLRLLRDFYFIIEHREQPVGLIHTSDIDWKQKTGHSGLFVWESRALGSHLPVFASLTMVDFFFSYCSLEKLFAKVMESNPVAIKYNTQLGFAADEPPNGKKFRQYCLTKADYFKATGRLHKMAAEVGGNDFEIEMEKPFFEALKQADALAAIPQPVTLR